MRFSMLCLFLGVVLMAAEIKADCADEKSWLDKTKCHLKETTDGLSESAKPYTDKIGEKTKEFGNTLAKTYNELKHKLTDDSPAAASTDETASVLAHNNAPTEKVPLAPLNDAGAQPAGTSQTAATGEQTEEPVSPQSIDDRFLLQPRECPSGQAVDHRNQCRPAK